MVPDARFVDVTYRGLSVASKAKLTESSATSGFVEVEAPLPVGTPVQIVEGETATPARVTAVVEQESGAKSPPGMRLAWGDEARAAAPAAPPADDPPEPEAEASGTSTPVANAAPEGRRRRRTKKGQANRA